MIEPMLAKRIQLVGLDVDGVLTDGGLYVGIVGGDAVEFKRFDAQDIIGIRLMRMAGIKVVLVSGRTSEATKVHAGEIGVDELIQDDEARKFPAFEGVLLRHQVRIDDAAYLGYDIADLPMLRQAGLPAVVANAAPEARALARHITLLTGGHGAVREFSEELLRARNVWDDLVQRYLQDRGDPNARGSRAFRAPGNG